MPLKKRMAREYGRAGRGGPIGALSSPPPWEAPWDIQIVVKRRVPKIALKSVREMLRAILADLEQSRPSGIRSRGMKPFPPPTVRQLSVMFIGDPQMQVLNSGYRGKDKPTDVLSFAALEGLSRKELCAEGLELSLGDLVISLDTAQRQAKRYRWSIGEELLRLLIHGVLHLLGYDHEGVPHREAALMRRIERRLLARHRAGSRRLVR